MSKIFKNLIPYWRWIILIFVFLIAQAYCDLALPAYTSDIIDVGIQDHGIEHILPEEITSEDYQMAQTFMLSDEKEKFTDCYEAQDASKSDDSVAKYKLTADSDTLDFGSSCNGISGLSVGGADGCGCISYPAASST